MPELSWDDLRYFLAVHRGGSYAAAARALGVDASTVGRRLRALEEALDAPLFERGPDGLTITQTGAAIVELVADAERCITAISVRASGVDDTLKGPVRVAMPNVLVPALVTPGLAELRDINPDLQLEVYTGPTPVALARGEADLSVRVMRPGVAVGSRGVKARRIGRAGFRLYASKRYLREHPIAPGADDLRGHRLVRYAGPAPYDPGGEWLDERSEGATVVARMGEMMAVGQAVASGECAGVLLDLFADTLGVVPVGPVVQTVNLWLAYRPEAKKLARVRQVSSWLVARADARLRAGAHER